MSEKPRRRQHLVSKGYQQNFADGVWVAVLDAHTGATVCARRSVRANWRVKDFVSVVWPNGDVDDSLEREFGDREQVFLNVVREIRLHTPVTSAQKAALDDLAATHLVRSLSFAAVHGEVVRSSTEQVVTQLAGDQEATLRFTRQRGRPPEPGELKALVAEVAGDLVTSPDFFADGVRRVAARIPGLLRKWRVQLVGTDSDLPGFIIADNPILHGRRSEGIFGFRDAGAIGDANLILVPISRRLVAFYTAQRRPDLHVRTKNGVRWINSLLLRGAWNEIACHPDDALETSRLIRHLDRYPPNEFDRVRIH